MAGAKRFSTKVIEQLKPKLRELYSKLPPALCSRIRELLDRADDPRVKASRVDPNRLLKYAWLLVVAEREVEGAAISRGHAERTRAELAGEYHGFEKGYQENTEAWRRYRQGRKARQRIAASLVGVLGNWEKAERVIRRNRPELPEQAQAAVSDEKLRTVSNGFNDMRQAMALGEAYPRKASSSKDESTRSIHTYMLWHNVMPNYKRKWGDMHELALVWKLTASQTTDSFRLVVLKSCAKINKLPVPFGSVGMAALSEDP